MDVFIIETILFLFVTFRARKILNESLINKKINRKVSWFFTLIFNFLYLQYEINRIIDNKELDKRVGPWILFLVLYVIPIISVIVFTIVVGSIFVALFNTIP